MSEIKDMLNISNAPASDIAEMTQQIVETTKAVIAADEEVCLLSEALYAFEQANDTYRKHVTFTKKQVQRIYPKM